MIFLDKVTQVLPGLLAGLTAMVCAGKPGEFGLECVALPTAAVQVDKRVADHQGLPW